MGAWKIRVIVAELAVLVTPWDSGRGHLRLSPRPQLAIAAGHASVVSRTRLHAGAGFCARGHCLPTGSFAQRANVRGNLHHLSLDDLSLHHLGHFHLYEILLFLTCTFDFAPEGHFCASRKGCTPV